MRNSLTVLGLAGLAVVAMLLLVNRMPEPAKPKYCRIRLGDIQPREFIIEREDDELRLYRDGLESPPEVYDFKRRSMDGSEIPPFVNDFGQAFQITSISEYDELDRVQMMVFGDWTETTDGSNSAAAELSQYCDVELVDSFEEMRYSHFGGPLTVRPPPVYWELPSDLRFHLDGRATNVQACVGTFEKEGGCWTIVSGIVEEAFPKEVRPQVEIRFPADNESGEIVRTYSIDQVLGEMVFECDITPPKGTTSGVAELTYTFGKWHRETQPTTVAVPVE